MRGSRRMVDSESGFGCHSGRRGHSRHPIPQGNIVGKRSILIGELIPQRHCGGNKPRFGAPVLSVHLPPAALQPAGRTTARSTKASTTVRHV